MKEFQRLRYKRVPLRARSAGATSEPVEVGFGDITGAPGDNAALAAALASGESPTYSNDYTLNADNTVAFNGGSVTLEAASSQVVVANASAVDKGCEFNSFTTTAGTRYGVLLEVKAISGAGAVWKLLTKWSGGVVLGYISQPGWYWYEFTAAGAGGKPTLVATLPTTATACTITLGYAAVYTSPSSVLSVSLGRIQAVRTDALRIVAGQGTVDESYTSTTLPTVRLGYNITTATDGSSTDGYQTAVGDNVNTSTFTSAGGYTSVGNLARVAVGTMAQARNWRATALGSGAAAVGVSSTALGFWTFAGPYHSCAVGRGTAIPIQMPSDTYSTAMMAAAVGDVYLNGHAHVIANPMDPDNLSLAHHLVGYIAPNTTPLTFHGTDAYDQRQHTQAAVADATARNAISTANRFYGMWVYVTADAKTYILNVPFGGDLSSNALWVDCATLAGYTASPSTTLKTATRANSGGICTVTFNNAGVSHLFGVGCKIAVSGLGAGYDGTGITVLSASTLAITYAETSAVGDETETADVDGTITIEDARSNNQPGGNLVLAAGRPTGTGANGSVSLAACSALDADPAGNTKGTLRNFLTIDGAEDGTSASAAVLRWAGTEYRVHVGAAGTGPGGGSQRALYVV